MSAQIPNREPFSVPSPSEAAPTIFVIHEARRRRAVHRAVRRAFWVLLCLAALWLGSAIEQDVRARPDWADMGGRR